MYLNLTDEVKKERCQLMNEIFKLNDLEYESAFDGFWLDGDYHPMYNVDVFNKHTKLIVFSFELEEQHYIDYQYDNTEDWLASFDLITSLLFEQIKDDSYRNENDIEITLKLEHFQKFKELYNFNDKKMIILII